MTMVAEESKARTTRYGLTDFDLELIKSLCLPDKVIGGMLGVSPKAVSMRITRIAVKLGVENRTAIVVKMLELGLITTGQLLYRSYGVGTNLS